MFTHTVESGISDVQAHTAHRYLRHTGNAGLSGFAGREPLLVNTETLTAVANREMLIAVGRQVVSLDNLLRSVFPVLGSVLRLWQPFNS